MVWALHHLRFRRLPLGRQQQGCGYASNRNNLQDSPAVRSVLFCVHFRVTPPDSARRAPALTYCTRCPIKLARPRSRYRAFAITSSAKLAANPPSTDLHSDSYSHESPPAVMGAISSRKRACCPMPENGTTYRAALLPAAIAAAWFSWNLPLVVASDREYDSITRTGRTFARGYGRTPPCQTRSKLRNESIGRAQYPCWGRPDCHCRWRAAHPRQPLGQRTKSLSVKRKSLTSVCRRSMSSTRKMPEYPGPAYNLPTTAAAGTAAEAAEAAAAGTEAAGLGGEVAEAVEAVEAAATGAGGAAFGSGAFIDIDAAGFCLCHRLH
jgi:hypothetical protein